MGEVAAERVLGAPSPPTLIRRSRLERGDWQTGLAGDGLGVDLRRDGEPAGCRGRLPDAAVERAGRADWRRGRRPSCWATFEVESVMRQLGAVGAAAAAAGGGPAGR